VALVGEAAEADTQTSINAVYAAYYPPDKVVAGCATHDEEGAGLIPLLAEHPARDGGRATAYVCEGYACQNPTTDPRGLARQLGIIS
jgi:uncharacterized protein YyaL (SSP411 family)